MGRCISIGDLGLSHCLVAQSRRNDSMLAGNLSD
jgi:hypothetical protein